MATEVFMSDSVGSYFKEHFVSVKYDIEKDSVGAALKRRFAITAVPTLLFIEPVGVNMVHKVVGGLNANQLLDVAEQAIDPNHNLQGLKKRYAQGERGKKFMNELIITLLFAGATFALAISLAFLVASKRSICFCICSSSIFSNNKPASFKT